MFSAQDQLKSMFTKMRNKIVRSSVMFAITYVVVSSASALDYGAMWNGATKAAQSIQGHVGNLSASSNTAGAAGEAGQVEVGFSPEGGALQLVIKAINASTQSLDVMAYSFTSSDVTRAILSALKRGVVVRVIADQKQNTSTKGAEYALSALSSLVSAGAEVRFNGNFSIFHDKVIIVDGKHVQTGSFNYSKAAAKSNSENVVVMWAASSVAARYGEHFKSRWETSQRFNGRP